MSSIDNVLFFYAPKDAEDRSAVGGTAEMSGGVVTSVFTHGGAAERKLMLDLLLREPESRAIQLLKDHDYKVLKGGKSV